MIQILHYLKDPKLWEIMGIFPYSGGVMQDFYHPPCFRLSEVCDQSNVAALGFPRGVSACSVGLGCGAFEGLG